MKKIPSFQKNHDTLAQGLYISTEMQGVTTFDLRMKKPNQNDFLSTASAHSIEHLIATILRNGEYSEKIIYFGPMGCRTGFYLLTTQMTFAEVKNELIRAFSMVQEFNEVPGSQKQECGNYLDHDLIQAKKDCQAYLEILNA